MGYIIHEAVIVTGNSYYNIEEEPDCPQDIKNIRQAIYDIYKKYDDEIEGTISDCVGQICGTGMNGTYAFLIAPDGSKEGWGLSQLGDDAREEAMEYLRTTARYKDSSGCDVSHLKYGGDFKCDWHNGVRPPLIEETL